MRQTMVICAVAVILALWTVAFKTNRLGNALSTLSETH